VNDPDINKTEIKHDHASATGNGDFTLHGRRDRMTVDDIVALGEAFRTCQLSKSLEIDAILALLQDLGRAQHT
jgi:hypothetical protein